MGKKTLCITIALLLLMLCAGCQKKANPLADGTYRIAASLTGGTGKAKIASPVEITVQGGQMTAILVWSSPNYDYMKVNGVRYVRRRDRGRPFGLHRARSFPGGAPPCGGGHGGHEHAP